MVSIKSLSVLAFSAVTLGATTTSTYGDYATYPAVPKTASINGFADPIYTKLPDCAQACVQEDTGITPCPYWDTGCLCVMQNWGGKVADCVASACRGDNVKSVTSLATSLCSSVGAPSPYWFIPATASEALVVAVTAA
ncbi:hypothetical protein CLIB1444_09S03114 [[Candida] jaroonii]|uniref:Uncharacterized protein n=1 Tax=[Candida] jaroonii TaxID=467808 RepID=A0ACA9YBH2_9ASCO|nr:hypothetical protein CLIB1444_09S03114 [[Candida] jaroonii]